MKVLITTDLFTPQVNGVVTSVINLYDELKKRGVDVRILTLSKEKQSYKEGDVYYVRSFPLRIYPNVRASISFKSHLIEEIIDWKPDVIHTQCEFSTMIFAKHIQQKVNCPIIHTYHTMYEHYVRYLFHYGEPLGKKLVSTLMYRLLHRCDRIIAPTEKVKRALRKFGLLNMIEVIPTGIDLSKFETKLTVEQKLQKRDELGIPKEQKIILFLGRVAKEKNIEELIDYFVQMKNNEAYTLLIVGGGPYEEELEKIVSEKKKENIIFTGMVPPKEVSQYYQISDVFSCASTSETQGLTYVEAMANGLPLICRYDDCLDDLLIDGENGRLFKNQKTFELAIDELMSDDDKRDRMSQNAKKMAFYYSKEYFADRVYETYLKTISRYHRGRKRQTLLG